jgi:hypothetical protein
MQCFYLGSHIPGWLGCAGVPLFISRPRTRAAQDAAPRRARVGRWTPAPRPSCCCSASGPPPLLTNVAAVRRYDAEIGELHWAAPQDMTCGPEVLQRTRLSVREHQLRTVENFIGLQMLWGDPAPVHSCRSCKASMPRSTSGAWTCTPPPASSWPITGSSVSAQCAGGRAPQRSTLGIWLESAHGPMDSFGVANVP